MVYLSELRSTWAETVLTDIYTKRASFLARHPLRSSHPLAEILSSLLLKRERSICPPLKLIEKPLPLGQFCQAALLQGDSALGNLLLQLTDFPSLWCKESVYSEEEALSSIELLRRAFGKEAQYTITDPYFRALAKCLPQFEEQNVDISSLCSVKSHEGVTVASVQSGDKIPMGAICIGNKMVVPAFGPQGSPLNNPELLGVSLMNGRWAQMGAYPDVWMEGVGLSTRLIGMTPQTPVSFVFYVRAGKAEIGSEVYASKSLRRYQGLAQKIRFDTFSIENKIPYKMELIPLAGSGAFWNADFLLAFAFPLHDPRVLFDVRAET